MKLSKIALNIKGSSTLTIAAKASKLINEGHDVIAFTVGEPDFKTPEYIKEAGIKAINEDCTTYTQVNGILPLRQAICEKLKTDNNLEYTPEEIVVSNGGKHSLTNTFFALLDEGDEVLIPNPYWLSYKSIVTLAGGVPVIVPTKKENKYKATIEDLEKSLTNKTKILLLNSPSNPTGVVLQEEELKAYADFAIKHDIIVVSDEIYEYLIYDENVKHISIASFKGMKERTVVINGVSKTYAMTGWRIGYTASPIELAKAMTNIQSQMTSNPCSISQHAALTAIKEKSPDLEIMKDAFKTRRDFLFEQINSVENLSCIYPEGAFYVYLDISKLIGKMVNGKIIKDCVDVTSILLDDFLVSVIPCTDFGSDVHIRLSYVISFEDIKKGFNRIADFAKAAK